jgi:ABC-type phosphate/phosphonate transport system substrate-binding protein
MEPIQLGAVAYDAKVVVIWDIIREYFDDQGCPLDYTLYTNYERLIDSLRSGQIEIAWNSPLAWLDQVRRVGAGCRAIAMRDTDQDRCSHILVRADSGIDSIDGLRGKTVGFGAKDSPQATLIPGWLLLRNGLVEGADYSARRFDVLVGKHGDHIGGERDALEALGRGELDACCALDLNWQLWSSDGTADADQVKVLATTDKFDHCVFGVREDFDLNRQGAFLECLHSMSYANPDHREMMDMEGLKEWKPGRVSGFGALSEAVEELGYWQ